MINGRWSEGGRIGLIWGCRDIWILDVNRLLGLGIGLGEF